jgi:DNA-binding transcriptional LysR family regulator
VALDEIPAEVLAATPVVQRDPMSNSSRVVAAALDRAGLQRVPPAVGIGSTAAVLEVARSTRTPALLSLLAVREFAADQGFVVRRVAGMRFDREYALVWAGALGDLPVAVQAVAQHMLDLPFARSRRASRAFG